MSKGFIILVGYGLLLLVLSISRNIHCLLCDVSKPFKGFLSHIRQKHLNYQRYKCTKCLFKSDDENDAILHSFEKNHDLKFDKANYQEHLAVKIFRDCCSEQFAIRHGMGKQEDVISELSKKRSNWNSGPDIRKICNSKKAKKKTNDPCSSSLLEREGNLQMMLENQENCGVAPNPTEYPNDEEKPESRIHITKIISKATADHSESCKLSELDKQTVYASGLFSGALENAKTINSDKLLNAFAVNNVVSIDGEGSRFDMKTSGTKKRAVEDVGVDYIARKTHALQFHFSQDDDPEITELLPATVKACFPHSLSWSDYQCTECGKTLGTYRSRRNHVLKEHFYWSAICPLSGCTTVISALDSLKKHFKLEHNISILKMSKGLKQKLRKIENDRKNDLLHKSSHCFPCSLPPKRQVAVKESANDSKHLPKSSITSVLFSLLHPQHINIAKKKNVAYSSSDTESSSVENEDDSGMKGEKHDVVNEESKM
ncbi:unnamed protein product [Cercopithifilaria johnstoni]|uniref:C2H2-type domain-containing protein n=1 Tax=Cercopithifilaria johnstoni TaxID=2874296 RepID=A0A8J2MJS5_9BILA|nr:unnamed protein product [Cercopithifilaria johnstoni]